MIDVSRAIILEPLICVFMSEKTTNFHAAPAEGVGELAVEGSRIRISIRAIGVFMSEKHSNSTRLLHNVEADSRSRDRGSESHPVRCWSMNE